MQREFIDQESTVKVGPFRIKKKILYRSDAGPYLIRYSILTTRWFSIKIHNILTSDDECLHDHPWTFISILLKGRYAEEGADKFRFYRAGNILLHRAKWKHRLIVGDPVWTFVITFRKSREWGFWTRKGFVSHAKYNSELCD